MCNAIIESYTLVEALLDVEPDSLTAIACSFEIGSDKTFQLSALLNTQKWKDFARDLRFKPTECILHYKDVITGSKRHFDLHKELLFYSDLYTELVQEGKYTPVLKPAANLLTQQLLEQTQRNAGGKKQQQGGKGKGNDSGFKT